MCNRSLLRPKASLRSVFALPGMCGGYWLIATCTCTFTALFAAQGLLLDITAALSTTDHHCVCVGVRQQFQHEYSVACSVWS